MKIKCANCNKVFYGDVKVGEDIRCPKCNTLLTIGSSKVYREEARG